MSALGVTDTGKLPSLYLQSKQAGEAAVRASALDWTIFRPSVIFGPDDRFINLFASLQRFAPLVPLAGADARLQPVYIGDVASAFVNVLQNPASFGRTYELAGPEVYRLRELVELSGRIHGCRRLVIGLPDWVGRLQAAVMEVLPGPPLMSMDNLDSLRQPNVATGPMAPELGIAHPTRLDAASATGSLARQQRLDQSRAAARRHLTE
jgi:NADH dehydrogenase